jgi:ribosome-associated toxin RatA of RatAB toxin-antitoxin module
MARISGSASEEIEAPLEAVWAVVADVASAPEWQDGMIAMHVFDTDEEGRATLVETESDAKVKTVKAKIRFSYHPPTRLAWAQEQGDLKSLDGSWVLEDLGGQRTRATYAIDGDPGRTLGMLIRGPVEGKIRDLLVNGRPGELKRRVEKGG